jgi:hypothetical protein
VYHIEGFFVSNPANRFAIGNMAEKRHPDPDDVLTITIQRDSPGKDKDGNLRPDARRGLLHGHAPVPARGEHVWRRLHPAAELTELAASPFPGGLQAFNSSMGTQRQAFARMIRAGADSGQCVSHRKTS